MTFDVSRIKEQYPFKSHFFDTGGLKLHYVDEGEGEPFFMVHGNPSWSFLYRGLIKHFSTKYRMVAPDHIGCGMSEKPQDDRYSFTLKSRIDDLEKLFDNLNFQKPVNLVVHDWGGPTGIGLAVRRPAMIKRLIIFNTAAFRLPSERAFPWPLWAFRNLSVADYMNCALNLFSVITAKTSTVKKMDEKVYYGFTGPYDSFENRVAVSRFVQDIPLSENDPSYKQLMEVEDGLQKFKNTPALICWGKKDFIFDLSFFREWKKHLPNAIYRNYDAGHYLLEDSLDEIIAEISKFLQNA
ncbi:MAG: alpha/beta fold hydrolase [Candidatus Riflebacteria bacterium]|nr:alpha/beta fold hydrolase [Candidatus Riflebacteria bacterium]